MPKVKEILVRKEHHGQVWYDVEEVNGYSKVKSNQRSKDRKSPPSREGPEGSSLPLQSISVIRRKDEI